MSITPERSAKPPVYEFHPIELSVMGFSGSGKTTLLAKLIERLKDRWSIAYVKHDSHGFEMDKAGKDTFLAKAAGAEAIFISSREQSAHIRDGAPSFLLRKSMLLDFDCALIEGYKDLEVDKICVIDNEARIFEGRTDVSWERVVAFVGPSSKPVPLPVDRPYFHRDEVDRISEWIADHLVQKIRQRPLKALVLGGGRSQRMGQDKSRLDYNGKPQIIWAAELLESLGIKTYLSLRADQERPGNFPTILDRFEGFGPIGGILSAQHDHPAAAWLVIACDLPLLDRATLQNLINQRDAKAMATAYRSSHDGLPEPLCAIYEPKIRLRLHEALGIGLACPRKVLIHSKTAIIQPIDARTLENANTPDDFRSLRLLLEERSHDA